MNSYKELVDTAYKVGDLRQTRVGPARSCFGLGWSHNMFHGFPILTTRQIFWRPVLGELAAFLQGEDHVEHFKALGCHYWDADAKRWDVGGYLGRIYGVQWRDWRNIHGEHYDQLQALVDGLKADPFGRRHILTAWNPGELEEMALPPCHILAQFYVKANEDSPPSLHCCVYMRSVDLCLGFPSDVVLYAMLLSLVAQEVGMQPHILRFFLGDAHIYENHVETWEQQRERRPHILPTMELNGTTLFEFDPDKPTLELYDHHGVLKYPLNTTETK